MAFILQFIIKVNKYINKQNIKINIREMNITSYKNKIHISFHFNTGCLFISTQMKEIMEKDVYVFMYVYNILEMCQTFFVSYSTSIAHI